MSTAHLKNVAGGWAGSPLPKTEILMTVSQTNLCWVAAVRQEHKNQYWLCIILNFFAAQLCILYFFAMRFCGIFKRLVPP
jgi:hypothetical protein